MNKDEFKRRTKAFAIYIARFCKTVPFDRIVRHYIDQIVRRSSSVGANYRLPAGQNLNLILSIRCE
jgi:hypothetical protein